MQSPKILNIPQMHTYNNPIMMLKIDHNLRKSNYVINRNRLHNYGTRNGAIPRLQSIRTDIGKNSTFGSCMERYIALEPSLTQQKNIHVFKK